MKAILMVVGIVLAILGFIGAVLIGVGLGVGWVLAWAIPGLNLGMGAVVGMIAVIGSIDLFIRFVTAIPGLVTHWEEEDAEAEEAAPAEPHVLSRERRTRRRKNRK